MSIESVAEKVVESVAENMPLIEDLFAIWFAQGKDPAAELAAMKDAAELAAIRAERAKFGP